MLEVVFDSSTKGALKHAMNYNPDSWRQGPIAFFGGFVFNNHVSENPYNDTIGRYYTLKRGYVDLRLTEAEIVALEKEDSLSFGSGTPIQITSINLTSFIPHKGALNMELIVDSNQVYTYENLRAMSPIQVERSFQVVFTANDHEVSSQWRFNMMSMDMTYTKEGQTYDTWIYYPFSGSGLVKIYSLTEEASFGLARFACS